ncbi:MAG TPA: hypothetical protein VGA37_15325 [Gemmatimonadales bacterium]
MDEDIVLYIVMTVTTLGLGGGALAAWYLWLKARTQHLGAGAREELVALRNVIEELRADMHGMYGELTAGQQELQERLDFAERLLPRAGKDPHDA